MNLEELLNFEKLLAKNYHGPVSEECKTKTMEYLAETESVSDQTILFVKRLTKVSTHLLESNPKSLDGLEEKIYQFSLEGTELVEDSREDYHKNLTNLFKMEAHLYSHAGNCALHLFEKRRKIIWLKKAYNTYLTSAKKSIVIEPKHCAHAYGYAGKVAKMLSEQVYSNNPGRQNKWERKWIRRAIDGFNHLLDYYQQKGKEKRKRLLKRIKSEKEELKERL